MERNAQNKPFRRAGIQEDGSVIQEITRTSVNEDGVRGKFPPMSGQRVIAVSGPFEVEKVVELITIDKKIYFRATGNLVPNLSEEDY